MTSRRLADAVLHSLSDSQDFDSTVERLGAAIRLGVFVRGEQLPSERQLAVRLGVSRVNLRVALAALREADMTQTRRGRGGGTTVTYSGAAAPAGSGPSSRRLADVLKFHRVVEPGAAYLAARSELTADECGWLADSEAQVRSAGPGAAHRIAESRLHLAVATLSGSPMLIAAVTRALSSLDAALSRLTVPPEGIEQSHRAHHAVVAAILASDPLAARAEMERHCDATAALLAGLLE